MPRKPFSGVGVYSVTNFTVRLPEGVERYMGWFEPGKSHECLAVPSPQGCISVFQPLDLERYRTRLAGLSGPPLRPADLGTSLPVVSRASIAFWDVTIQPTRDLRLPEMPRKLGLLPNERNGQIAIVTARGVLELWKVEELRAELVRVAGLDVSDDED